MAQYTIDRLPSGEYRVFDDNDEYVKHCHCVSDAIKSVVDVGDNTEQVTISVGVLYDLLQEI